jgi:hypothetical protein
MAVGFVYEREGGSSALAYTGGDLARLRKLAELCTGPGSSPLCQLTLGLNSGSLASGVASIVRSLAQTGLELLPLIALCLMLAASGALALAMAGGRFDEASLSAATAVRTWKA